MERFIVQLIELLSNWKDDAKMLAIQSKEYYTFKLIKDFLIHAKDLLFSWPQKFTLQMKVT